MSSDSEDDCYGNIAQKLQSLKNNYREDKIETTNLLIADLKEKTDNSWRKNYSLTSEKDGDLSQSSETTEELTLDAIIAKNSKRATRSNKRALINVENILPETKSRPKRRKKSDPSTSQTENPTQSANPVNTDSIVDTIVVNSNSDIANASSVNDISTRARGSRGRRGSRPSPRRGRGRRQLTVPEMFPPSTSGATRARGRNGRRRPRGQSHGSSLDRDPSIYDLVAALAASEALANGSSDQIYSVGNTDEYPDQCDDQALFSSAPKPQSDVIIVENDPNQSLDDNEELSVKVYWQSAEHVKFNIRRFQKLSQIFDHFAEREKIGHDKLFFTYNDRIIKCTDTPDTIKYNIAKFIDGGVVNQSVSALVKKGGRQDGIQLKFQCQNVKKPFIGNVLPDDPMLVVMMKCAEHLEMPLDKLKFHFDGDLISGKNTPRGLELEGGECIDVSIIS